MNFFSVLTLAGGLAFFLYGMNVMSHSLERLAGGKFEAILQAIMSNKVKALLLGVGVTAAIQSSSATTVMVIGLVNSEIMSLHQAINVILGAKVGTTVTAWLLSMTGISSDNFFLQMLKPSSFAPVLALIGVIFIMKKGSAKRANIGRILVGFAVLMAGISTMSDAMTPLGESEQFTHIMEVLTNPALAFLVGLALTAIVQSSSASVGILQAIALSSPIGYAVVVPMVVGQNVGASISPMLASIGQGKNGKRAAYSYLFANLIGAAVFLALFYVINGVIDFGFMHQTAGIAGIAVIHTLFNVFVVIVLFPFTKYMEKLMLKIVPDRADEEEEDTTFASLDENFLATPTFALQRAKHLIDEMGEQSLAAIKDATDILLEYDQTKFDSIGFTENRLDNYEDEIGKYLVQLGRKNLSTVDSRGLSLELQSIGDLERISDHALNIAEAAQEMHDKKLSLSPAATEDIKLFNAAVVEILTHTVDAFVNQDDAVAKNVEPLEQVIDEMSVLIKNRHIERLKSGECTIEMGFILASITTNMERIADHCSNLAIYIIQLINKDSLEAHEYLNALELNKLDWFQETYKHYKSKYELK
ncbi:MAG: Na/Pi cotransporter family protein [Eubacterium sp.]|nr:Na/Pi cotransporter family protein [Candidatus Colimonas fimequi]